MNWDRVQGNWKQTKGKIKEHWGKLTDDQLDQIQGRRDQLVGRIQECYGIARDKAEAEVSDWEKGHQHVFAETSAEAKKHLGGLSGQ